MFRGSVKGTGYPRYSPISPSLPLPCVTKCHHISTGFKCWIHHVPRQCEGYWLPMLFANFPFTSPPVRHRVPSHFRWSLLIQINILLWSNSRQWARASSFTRLYDQTQKHHSRQDSSGRVISWSYRPLPDNKQHSQQTGFYASTGFEIATPASKLQQTHALDCAATEIGFVLISVCTNRVYFFGAFAKFQTAAISFVMSIRPSVQDNSVPTRRISEKFRKSVQTIQTTLN